MYSILTSAPPTDDLVVESVLLIILCKPENTQLDCSGKHDAKDVVQLGHSFINSSGNITQQYVIQSRSSFFRLLFQPILKLAVNLPSFQTNSSCCWGLVIFSHVPSQVLPATLDNSIILDANLD